MKNQDTGDYRQTTVTLPSALFLQLTEEAKKRGISYNRHVVSILEGRPMVAIDLQPLVIEIARLRRTMETGNIAVDVKKEVYESCRYLECFVAEQIRRLK